MSVQGLPNGEPEGRASRSSRHELSHLPAALLWPWSLAVSSNPLILHIILQSHLDLQRKASCPRLSDSLLLAPGSKRTRLPWLHRSPSPGFRPSHLVFQSVTATVYAP